MSSISSVDGAVDILTNSHLQCLVIVFLLCRCKKLALQHSVDTAATSVANDCDKIMGGAGQV